MNRCERLAMEIAAAKANNKTAPAATVKKSCAEQRTP